MHSLNQNEQSHQENESATFSSPSRTDRCVNASTAISSSLFFADATLDLSMAHDIADSPDHHPQRARFLQQQQQQQLLPAVPFTTISASSSFDNDDRDAVISTKSTAIANIRVVDEMTVNTNDIQSATTAEKLENAAANDSSNAMSDPNATDTTSYNNHDESNQMSNTNNNFDQMLFRIVKPKYPRDISWTILFMMMVPVSFIYPIVFTKKSPGANGGSTSDHSKMKLFAHHPLSFATIHAIVWSAITTFVLVRLLYTSRANRMRLLVPILLTSIAPLSIFVYIILTVTVLYVTAKSTLSYWITILPLLLTLREIFIYTKYITRRVNTINDIGYVSRSTFFHEIYSMVLDTLFHMIPRSTKIKRIFRTITILISCQILLVVLWRIALLNILDAASSYPVTTSLHVIYVCCLGFWMTSTITNFISYIIYSCIMHYYYTMSSLEPQQETNGISTSNNHNIDIEFLPSTSSMASQRQQIDNINDNEEDDTISVFSRQNSSIPEAYRTIDASVYQSVASSYYIDDEDDDDDQDDSLLSDDEINDNNKHRIKYHGEEGTPRHTSVLFESNKSKTSYSRISNSRSRLDYNAYANNNFITGATMKSIIYTGCTINLGSILYYSLVNGFHQWISNHKQYVNFLRDNHYHRRNQNQQQANTAESDQNVSMNHDRNEFHGMMIASGHSSNSSDESGDRLRGLRTILSGVVLSLSSTKFHYQYLVMSHIATYYKSYQRALNDVHTIIYEAGLVPVLDEDITIQICTSICNILSCTIVLITTILLLHQKSHISSITNDEITELHVIATMFMSYIFSYTIIYTTFEPIRSAVGASYMAFAHNPLCFLHTYPLIYHRLHRLSTSRTSTTMN